MKQWGQSKTSPAMFDTMGIRADANGGVCVKLLISNSGNVLEYSLFSITHVNGKGAVEQVIQN